ncbi:MULTISPECIES: hypothetical protein [Saccharopolyspora]|uniref:Uncharacterized protein n=1 Tax=Saccharopolyspora cebuensis TaxID=418759 RepID=A0ABV4CPJ2_9PSEU
MDAANTVRIPRSVVGAAEEAQHPDTTQVLPNSAPPQQVQQPQAPQAPPQQQTGWPSQDYGQLPPNPYHAQRGPDEFGPLGSAPQHYPQY